MDEAHKASILSRVGRIEGQIRGIAKMIGEERYCIDILTQTASVVSALRGVEDLVLEHHLQTCVAEAMRGDEPRLKEQKIDEVMAVLSRFRKRG